MIKLGSKFVCVCVTRVCGSAKLGICAEKRANLDLQDDGDVALYFVLASHGVKAQLIKRKEERVCELSVHWDGKKVSKKRGGTSVRV